MNMSERLSTAGIVTLEGMVVIFVVLALLWAVVEILHFALHRTGKKKEAPAPAPSAPAPVTPAEPTPEEEDRGALIAAITAAVAASLAEDGYTGGFRVVSFRRSNASRKNRV